MRNPATPPLPQVPRRAPGGRGGRPGAGGGRSASLVWFRSDLRLHDNPVLAAAVRDSTSVLPVFVFDPRDYKQVGCKCVVRRMPYGACTA